MKRKNDPLRGTLSIPGGYINEGETAEGAMIREAKGKASPVVELITI